MHPEGEFMRMTSDVCVLPKAGTDVSDSAVSQICRYTTDVHRISSHR